MTGTLLRDDFSAGLSDRWNRSSPAGGSLTVTGQTVRLVNRDTTPRRYSNAQIDDYVTLPRNRFPWSPPLTLIVRARFSHPSPERESNSDCDFQYLPDPDGGPILSGTAGFGFWNEPMSLPVRQNQPMFARPRAIWFFYASPPSNMKLDMDAPGCGWKAAAIDASRWPFLALAPSMPISIPLMNLPGAYRRLWPIGQRAIRVSEAVVPVKMTDWHTYVIHWNEQVARFLVDDQVIMDCNRAPRGPLGLVIWLDNRFMIITPQGRLRWGLLEQPGCQWLELDYLTIKSGSQARAHHS
ncbi:MAG: family 16 glycosylhydrolase [Chloroflexota bacterium]|nr:family 16 glycosylhydrolase [Chloroflexota bacterium]